MQIFKHAELMPAEILAGNSTEFIIKLIVGKDFTSSASRIIVDFSAMLGTSCPSLMINEDSGYIEVYISNPHVEYTKRCWDLDYQYFTDREHPASREAQRILVLDLNGRLNEDDTVEIHWGEVYGGFGPGTKVSTVVPRKNHYGRIDIRYFSDLSRGIPDKGGDFEDYKRPEPDWCARLKYRILPRELHSLRLIRKISKAMLLPLDIFKNITEIKDISKLVKCREQYTINPEGVPEYDNPDVNVEINYSALENGKDSREIKVCEFHEPSTKECRSGDMVKRFFVPSFSETPQFYNVFDGFNIYWGDIHTHSALSCDCIRRSGMNMYPDDLAVFARYRAGLDFFAVTDHHVPQLKHKKLLKHQWDQIVSVSEEYNTPGEFVMFPGFELSCPRGDTVFILNEYTTYEEINKPWADIRDTWKCLEEKDYISIPHFHSQGGLPEGTWWENPAFEKEPVLEIFSDHGSYERENVIENGRALCKSFRKDRCGVWFLENGFKYGFTAHSDDHKGHVGVNGITAVFAKELTRDAVIDAYRKRHVYATSNARIKLLFTANEMLMGSVIRNTEKKYFRIEIHGEAPLKKVEVFKNGEKFRMFIPGEKIFNTEFSDTSCEPSNWYVRATQIDNHIAISSPVWFEN